MNDGILYIAADYEALKFCKQKIDVEKLLKKHFVYSCLLSDRVVIPAGCYFGSPVATKIVDTYRLLFLPYNNQRPTAELPIGDDRESFRDDARIKASWFPEPYNFTDTDLMDRMAHNLDDIEPTIRTGKMRKRLKDNILSDIGRDGESFKCIKDTGFSIRETAALVNPLKIIVNEQEYAMLPPYIRIEMERQGTSTSLNKIVQERWLDFVLFKNYAKSCEQAYSAYVNNPLSLFYGNPFKSIYSFKVDYRDTMLFEQFLLLFPIQELKNIENKDSKSILKIKNHPYVRYYLRCYRAVVERIKESITLYVAKQDYSSISGVLDYEYEIERKVFLKQIAVANTAEAISLYRALKNAFVTKKSAFKSWLTNNRSLELPMIQILEVLKDDAQGIMPKFIEELACVSQHTCKEKRMMKPIIADKNSPHNLTISKHREDEKTTSKRFAVALSFPGEYRWFVEPIAVSLAQSFGSQDKVLYDKFHEAEFARFNFDVRLQKLYLNESELVVVFLCEEYNRKPWCALEFSAIRTLKNDKNTEYRVMLVRLDDGNVDGIFETVDGWVDARDKGWRHVFSCILERYKINKQEELDEKHNQ